jgi:hypothetical protein
MTFGFELKDSTSDNDHLEDDLGGKDEDLKDQDLIDEEYSATKHEPSE